MQNKYTLKFQDKKIEDQYQEYLTMTVRKITLLGIIICQFLWNTVDLVQSLIQQQFELMTVKVILLQYITYYIVMGIFILIYCFKPHLIWVALFICNHLLTYSYWVQDQIYTYQQANLHTSVTVSTQMIILMSANCIEMVYQITLIIGIYISKMVLEDLPYTYSLIFGPIIAAFTLMNILYHIQRALRDQFKIRFMNNQWETIFYTLIPGQYLTLDYNTYSFNFINQRNFPKSIINTQTLREFLRSTLLKDKIGNLEQYLHQKVIQTNEHNIYQETLQINLGKFTSIKISIFHGARPILVLQKDRDEDESARECQLNKQNFQQSYYEQCKMYLAKRFLFLSKKSFSENLKQFRKYWIYADYKENFAFLQKNPIKQKPQQFSIMKLLKNIAKLYPNRKIVIFNPNLIIYVQNNKQLLQTLFIEIFENIVSPEVMIQLNRVSSEQVGICFQGLFNEKNFNGAIKLIENNKLFITSIDFILFSIKMFLFRN